MQSKFVIDHIDECRAAADVNSEPCRKTPIAVAIDRVIEDKDNFYPVCLECILKYKVDNEDLVPIHRLPWIIGTPPMLPIIGVDCET